MAATQKKETANRPRAFSLSFGNMMAWLYSRVTPAAMMPAMASKDPAIPKSEGVKRRLMTGANPMLMTWAMPVPAMTTRIFLKKTEALAFESRSFRYDLIDDPGRYPS
jgi:hypothetical protein